MITARWMLRNLRYSILAIFVVAAIITAYCRILNMCLFGRPNDSPLRLSIGVAWLVNSAQARRRRFLVCSAASAFMHLPKAIPEVPRLRYVTPVYEHFVDFGIKGRPRVL